MEIWKGIPDWEEYEISNIGRIRSIRNGKLRTTSIQSTGYEAITLYRNSTNTGKYVHRLVALAFIPNPNGYSCVNHINRDRSDNRTENLEWVSYNENNTYRYEGVKMHSPYTGVTWNKTNRKWEAYIKVKQRRIYLGLHVSEQEAHNAYLEALKAYKIDNKYSVSTI